MQEEEISMYIFLASDPLSVLGQISALILLIYLFVLILIGLALALVLLIGMTLSLIHI